MATITIHSTEFDAMIDVECDREGVTDASYSETGECLSQAEFMRLERNSEDQREISNEYAAYRFMEITDGKLPFRASACA